MGCDIDSEKLWSLIDRDAPELEAHLEVCEKCRKEAARIREAIGGLEAAAGAEAADAEAAGDAEAAEAAPAPGETEVAAPDPPECVHRVMPDLDPARTEGTCQCRDGRFRLRAKFP